VAERLYRLRHDQEVFETGSAQGKQLLLACTVTDILLHWFSLEGVFLELERHPLSTGAGPGYEAKVFQEVAALKERLGFRPHPIQVRKFLSEEACIEDLPGEYQEFLDHPERFCAADRSAFAGHLHQWYESGAFVLEFTEQYWMSPEGEVTHS
jgi:hypothetical protein